MCYHMGLDKVSSPNTVPTQSQSQWADHRTLIGLVEICLEKPTGLLTSPMRPVDFFGLLPANKAKQGSGFKPYICNLCIAEAGRRKGLGKLLCSICEQVMFIKTIMMHTYILHVHMLYIVYLYLFIRFKIRIY